MQNLSQILEKTFVAVVDHRASIGSTNDRAIECAADPMVKLPLLIVADQQTAGRGRGSHRWWTGKGSLAFSLLVPPPLASAPGTPRSALVALATGIAVVDAIAPLAAASTIGIHWPNDVMADGRKLAGILIEVLPDERHVIGIGINANNTAADAPVEIRERVATLRDMTGRTQDPSELLISLLGHIERQLAELAAAPERTAARTHELCLQRGRMLAICQGEATVTGRCRGIAADGALLLECDGKLRAIYSGEIAPDCVPDQL